jgi:hypothetical protein
MYESSFNNKTLKGHTTGPRINREGGNISNKRDREGKFYFIRVACEGWADIIHVACCCVQKEISFAKHLHSFTWFEEF